MMNTVSVVIPTFNREATLLRAIGSVLEQTVPVLEIIVCDDGSTDRSRSRVTALNNPAVRWVDCGRNGLPSVPRNVGIKNAHGEYIAFLDSDDTWLPLKIERQLAALMTSGKAAVSSNAIHIKAGKNRGEYLLYRKNRITLSDFVPVNYAVCSSVMVKKSLLEQVSLFPEDQKYRAIEDYALWLRLATRTDFSYLREPLVEYYDDPQTSIRAVSDARNERKVIFTGFIEWVRRNGVTLRWADARNVLRAYYKSIRPGKLSLGKRLKCMLGRIPSAIS